MAGSKLRKKQVSKFLAAPLEIQRATAEDSAAISRLFTQTYGAPNVDEGDLYPYPQFLIAPQVERLLQDPRFLWVVAKREGKVVGTFSGLRGIGASADRLAECLGLVVDPACRRQGIAGSLVRALTRQLHEEGWALITQTTARQSWMLGVFRRAGFQVTGFAPFQMALPTGLDSTFWLQRVPEARFELPADNRQNSQKVEWLAEEITKQGKRQPPTAPGQASRPLPLELPRYFAERQDVDGREFLNAWTPSASPQNGMLNGRRLEGNNSRRTAERFYVGRSGNSTWGAARVLIDTLDCQARIVELQVRQEGLQGILLKSILRDLNDTWGGNPRTVVAEVVNTHPRLQATLEACGFLPTAYFPGLIRAGAGFADVIRYTQLVSLDFLHSRRGLTALGPLEQRLLSRLDGIFRNEI